MALALGRQGYRVQLLEQLQEIAPIGYGVQLGPNVLPMLDELGVGEAVRASAYLPPALILCDAYTGQQLGHMPLHGKDFDALYNHPYITIHRVDLHEILLAACRAQPNIEMVEGCTVTDFSQSADAVQVECADGRRFDAQALIAADGMRSRVRTKLFPDDVPRDTGYVAHRSIIPWTEAPASLRQRQGVTMFAGDGFHVIFYPLRGQTELNIVAVFRLDAILNETDTSHHDQLISVTSSCQPEVRDALASMNLERRWSIADREPLRRWSEGRVTLLGDSAHATLQSLAQGAGMAIEDVVVLDRLVRNAGNQWPAVFARFNRTRLTRTARVQLVSRALWEEYHCGGIAAQVRNEQWSERRHADFLQCMQWLWNPIELDPAAEHPHFPNNEP